ncbi:MAG: twin-arginine translocation pathway signal protein, partial [Actinobacteria bacterium]|nr:twin-arginine translocation pathway signal protein [Actinomycetota bacterium]
MRVAGWMSGTAVLAMTAAVPVTAQTPRREAIVRLVEQRHDATVKALQAWIALPTIAAEKRNVAEGADYMRRLALDAGFQQAKVIPTDGVPGVFATLDSGAKTTLGIYFMYDVKQFDPAEWNSPPLEGKLVDRAGEGLTIVGRGAVNQKGPQMAFLAAIKAIQASG